MRILAAFLLLLLVPGRAFADERWFIFSIGDTLGRFTVAAAIFLGVFTVVFAAWAAWTRGQADRETAMARDGC